MAHNERGAGRKPEPWEKVRMNVPKPIHKEIKERINQWKAEQKVNQHA